MSASQIVLYVDGEAQVADPAAGGLNGIPQSAVTNLDSALSTLTTSVTTANSNASTAVTTANAADTAASAAQTAATGAQTQATNSASSAATAQTAATASATSASSATTAANNSATSATSAQSAATASAASASDAASDASLAISTANGAVTTANAASTAASAAVTTANAANSNASTALSTANAALPKTGGTVSGDVTVTGNLKVQGDIVYTDETRTLIRDPFVDFGIGNVGGAQAGGFTVNVVGGAAANNVLSFVEGVTGGSAANPYFNTSDVVTYTDGALIQIAGSKSNDGIYVVKAVSGPVAGVYKVAVYGTSAMPETRPAYVPFAQNNFVAESVSVAGSVSSATAKVASTAASDGASFNGIAAGQFCIAYGSTLADFNDYWVELSPLSVEAVGEVVLAGDLLAFNSSGDLVKASNVFSDGKYDVRRVALVNGASAASIKVIGGRGAKPAVNFTGSTPVKGARVYLSDTAGKATTGAISGTGKAVVIIGRVVAAISASSARVDFAPFVQIVLP